MDNPDKPETQTIVDVQVHRRKHELLWTFRKFARDRDEEGFKRYLIEVLHMNQDDARFSSALSHFWTLVRELENRLGR